MSKKLLKLLEECSIKKGGHNVLPTRPRPKTPPPGQGGKTSKYLEFSIIEKKPKTDKIAIESKMTGHRLGIIMWYAPWRQYAFFPNIDTIFNTECLNDIQIHMKTIMEERKK